MIHLQGDSHLQIILFSISEYHISYCFSEGLYNILHCLKIKISLVMKSQKIINFGFTLENVTVEKLDMSFSAKK